MHNVGIKKCQVFVVNEEILSMQVALSCFPIGPKPRTLML